MSIFTRIRNLWKRDALDENLNEELRAHLEMRAELNAADGTSPEEARYEAQKRFGNSTLLKEKTRDADLISWIEAAGKDLRFALRMIRKSPGFTAVAILTLSLAIGANTAIFSLLDSVLLRDLPVGHPEQLVQLATITKTSPEAGLSFPMFQEIGRRQEVFSSLIGWYPDRLSNVEVNGTLSRVDNWFVTGNFYSELGIRPFAGRLISESDLNLTTLDSSRVVVIGHRFWERSCGSDPGIVGRSIRVEGVPFVVIGIAPKEFTGFSVTIEPDIIAPLTARPIIDGRLVDVMNDAGSQGMTVVGRLKAGVELDQARTQLNVVWPAIKSAIVPPKYMGMRRDDFLAIALTPKSASRGIERLVRSRFTQPLYILTGIAALILLISCVNLASLMLSRTAARAREVGVRLALGASWWLVARLVLFESFILAGAGAMFGLVFAHWSIRAITLLLLRDAPLTPSISPSPDLRVLGLTSAMALTVGVLISIAAMWWIARRDSAKLLQQSSRVAGGSGRLGPLLVSAQIALSLVMLMITGLLVRTVQELRAVPLNLQTEGIVNVQVYPRPNGYKQIDSDTYQPALVDRIGAIPGIRDVSLTFVTPLSGYVSLQPVAAIASTVEAQSAFNSVSPGFFHTLDIPLIRGRDFAWTDNSRASRVAIVSQSLARQVFGEDDAVGQHIRIGTLPARQNLEIVGIVADARLYDVHRATPLAVYVAQLQEGDTAMWKAVLLRANSLAAVNGDGLRRAVESLGHEYVLTTRTLDDVTNAAITQERVTATLGTFFGVLALLLAGIGLYGVMAYSVTQRQKEFGVRLALGAAPRGILWSVILASGRIAAVGITTGVGLAYAAAQLVKSRLFGIAAYDPVTLATVSLLLLFAAVLASLVPARRAARVDPIISLRGD